MKKSWTFTDQYGGNHTITYKNTFGNKLIVDNQVFKVKSQNWFLNVLDYSIEIAGTDIRLVVIGNKVDVAINGVYIESGEKYIPVQANTPGYVWVLVGISIIGGWFLCGVFGILVGVMMSQLYVRNGLNRNTGAVIGCFAGCIAIQVAIMFVVSIIYASVYY